MALADYRLCDICDCKAFSDANLDYDYDTHNERTDGPQLGYVGDMAVICEDCAKTYKVVIVEIKGEKDEQI